MTGMDGERRMAEDGWIEWSAQDVKGPVDGSSDLYDFVTVDGRTHYGQRAPRFWHLVSRFRPAKDPT